MKRRLKFKVKLTEAELTHWQAAISANRVLPEELHLSEHDITRLCCGRKNPSPEQAAALAAVLGCSVESIFPDVASSLRSVADAIAPASLDYVSGGKNVSKVRKGGEA